ncbi:DoxX family protein [Rhodococcus qingshengii]
MIGEWRPREVRARQLRARPVPPSWLPMLGTAKLAGGIGLMIGLLGGRPVVLLAAIGLILFFLGAVVRPIQTRMYYNIAFPGTFLLLSFVSVPALLSI